MLSLLPMLAACGDMDSFFPSAVTYRISARADGRPLSDLSFVTSRTVIQPFFEDSVSEDPDVTALAVFLRNDIGEVAGWRVIYLIDADIDEPEAEQEQAQDLQEADGGEAEKSDEENPEETTEETITTNEPEPIPFIRNGDELIFRVRSLDNNLPPFPIPSVLPAGRYSLVFQVMSGNRVIFTADESIFYLSEMNFNFESINVHQSGIVASTQLVSRGTVVMLEAQIDFDSRFDPYIIWFSGRHSRRQIISEGRLSEGAGIILLETPEQTGPHPVWAEVFPFSENRHGLAGFSRDINLIVASQRQNVHLLSKNAPNMLHWYLFESNLNDSNAAVPKESAMMPLRNTPIHWMPANGTFGLAAGTGSAYRLPVIQFSEEGGSWKILCRFMPLNDGVVLSIQFGALSDVELELRTEDNNLILTLGSPAGYVSDSIYISNNDSFIITEIKFSLQSEILSADFNIIGHARRYGETETLQISVETEALKEYRVTLGSIPASSGLESNNRIRRSSYTAIWNEFAIFNSLSAELEEYVQTMIREVFSVQADESDLDENEPVEEEAIAIAQTITETEELPEEREPALTDMLSAEIIQELPEEYEETFDEDEQPELIAIYDLEN